MRYCHYFSTVFTHIFVKWIMPPYIPELVLILIIPINTINSYFISYFVFHILYSYIFHINITPPYRLSFYKSVFAV